MYCLIFLASVVLLLLTALTNCRVSIRMWFAHIKQKMVNSGLHGLGKFPALPLSSNTDFLTDCKTVFVCSLLSGKLNLQQNAGTSRPCASSGSCWFCVPHVTILDRLLETTSGAATATDLWPSLSRTGWISLWLTFSIHPHSTAKVYIWSSSHLCLRASNFPSHPWGKVKKKNSHHGYHVPWPVLISCPGPLPAFFLGSLKFSQASEPTGSFWDF